MTSGLHVRLAIGLLSLVFAGVTCGASPDAFQGARAFADLEAQVAFGPRSAGSAGGARVRAWILERLEEAGWETESQPFLARPPGRAPVSMVNLVATRPGRGEERILLAAHYDTKDIPGVRFVGANDGASGVALLLELARCLGTEPREATIQLLFFDGEEAFGPQITPEDGLYGSREFAQRLAQRGELSGIRALILFDMIADRDLNLAVDRRSSPALRALLREVAPDLVDDRQQLSLVDDHAPFLERGMDAALALIDFQFGARTSPGPHWHTARDDLDAVSEESLDRMGGVALALLRRLEAQAGTK